MTKTDELQVQASPDNDSRARLVRGAARLVHAESYHSVGVKAICDEAGVQRGSFYHFFESKQALMLESLELMWQRFVDEGLATCRDETLLPRERIDGMIQHAASKQHRYKASTGRVLGCAFGNLAAEAATLDDGLRLRLQQIFDDWAEIVAQPLAEAQRRDEIDACLAPYKAACEIVASVQGLMVLAKVRNDPDTITACGGVITDNLWGCTNHVD